MLEETTPATEASPVDEGERDGDLCPVTRGGHLEESAEIIGVLGSPPVVPGEHLQGQEIGDERHRQDDVGEHLDGLCSGDKLRFNARGGEQQVDHHARVGPVGRS